MLSLALYLSILVSAPTAEPVTLDLTTLSEPVLYGHAPLIVADRLFIYDKFDARVKAYVLSDDKTALRFLWATPGAGMGPGEIPKGAWVNNLAWSQSDGNLWVSHRYGFTIFGTDGQFFRNLKRPYSQAQVAIVDKSMILTSGNSIKTRILLQKINPRKEAPDWTLPSLHGIPVNEKGAFIEDVLELVPIDGGYALYNLTLGHLYVVDLAGELDMFLELPFQRYEAFTIEDYNDDYQYGRGQFTLTRLPEGSNLSGIVQDGNKLWVTLQTYCRGVQTNEGTYDTTDERGYPTLTRVLCVVDLDKGTIKGKYFAPPLQDMQYSLLQIDAQALWVFETEHGEKLVQVPRSMIEPVLGLDF